MMNNFNILWQNKQFMMDTYGLNGLFGLIGILVLVDLALKGWALWRMARMEKKWWFIALLVVNSLGIFPAIVLVFTNEEYNKMISRK
ncbi:MAG: DUF5652 family protein [Candidatus Peribacteraceae bacterium]|nr:DUF5652 family protein [Candidatus Peribacteraceae bacterium]MDD5074998.1 DUF5652 family protein [Candidatus Peribacteraceae bacterium]